MLKLGFRYLRKIGKPPKTDKGNLSPNDLEFLAVNAGFSIEENNLLGEGDKIKALYFKGVKKQKKISQIYKGTNHNYIVSFN